MPGENRELRMELIRAGQGIGKHVDRTHCFDEPVASVSLLSGAIMEFRHRRKEVRKSIYLQPCSLVVMKGNVTLRIVVANC